jgi:3-hydroxyacyl-[acyl-carrier-protein] dehydratase
VAVSTERWRELLPWKHPFLTIDRLIECVPHEHIITLKQVSGDDLLVLAHRPGGAVVPGVMVLEGLNQSAALLSLLSHGSSGPGRIPLLGFLRAAFPGAAVPGDTITYAVRAVKMTPTHGLFEGKAQVEGRTIVEGDLGFAMVSPGAS